MNPSLSKLRSGSRSTSRRRVVGFVLALLVSLFFVGVQEIKVIYNIFDYYDTYVQHRPVQLLQEETSEAATIAVDLPFSKVEEETKDEPPPIKLCKHNSCRQRDTPGDTQLKIHRGLSLMLHQNNCSGTPMQQHQCMLVYVMIPKAGSTTVKDTLKIAGKTEKVWLSKDDGTGMASENPFIFTVIRDPGERIVSAYSTIMRRTRGMYGVGDGKRFRFPAAPPANASESLWMQQFKESIHGMMVLVKDYGWSQNNTAPIVWNEHIIPQVEFMRGLNISLIDCLGSINETMSKFHLDTSFHGRRSNVYEHSDKLMPTRKLGSFDLLDAETKALVRELYDEDFKLFESTCASKVL